MYLLRWPSNSEKNPKKHNVDEMFIIIIIIVFSTSMYFAFIVSLLYFANFESAIFQLQKCEKSPVGFLIKLFSGGGLALGMWELHSGLNDDDA